MCTDEGRLNTSVLFSNEIDEHVLTDFKSALQSETVNRILSDHALIESARKVGVEILKSHNFHETEVDTDDHKSLLLGLNIMDLE